MLNYVIGFASGFVVIALASLCLEVSDYYHYKALREKRKEFKERLKDENK